MSGQVSDRDRDRVEALLGRVPQGAFTVVVRSDAGEPVVIRNEPLLDDGTPMPTRFWLVDDGLRAAVGRLEAAGGVRRAEAEVDPVALADAHERYRRERDAALPVDHRGPRPHGGVGGTRTGVKCLHAHLAWHLAGGTDPVGAWVEAHLDEAIRRHPAPAASRRRIDVDSAPTVSSDSVAVVGSRRIDDESAPIGPLPTADGRRYPS